MECDSEVRCRDAIKPDQVPCIACRFTSVMGLFSIMSTVGSLFRCLAPKQPYRSHILDSVISSVAAVREFTSSSYDTFR